MLFNSASFLIFFPIVVLVYYIVPDKVKSIWLLIASYYFYMSWNAVYALLILASTFVTYVSGILIEKHNKTNDLTQKKVSKKVIILLCLLINLGILFYFKYYNFTVSLIESLMRKFGLSLVAPSIDVVLPVGISFYTFQALGYVIDVYRGDIYAEKNFIQYALFVSFFPQLVAGPIERSKNLLKQLALPNRFNYDEAREGLLLMLWGYFLKIVLADRIAIFVDKVYGHYETYAGYYLAVATMLFAVQIYCDFAGYSTIAIGAAKFIGINLTENFDAPYISTSVADFWRKWHISLTSWFTDYLYIPLGGNRKGKIRKYCNKLIVFLISGLWHGASTSFVIWGGLNGIYQILGEILIPLRNKIITSMRVDRNSIGHRAISAVFTFTMVDFAWIFFRANTTSDAINIIKAMFGCRNPWILFDGSLYTCGLDQKNFTVMLIGIALLLIVDLCKSKGIRIREVVIKQSLWCRLVVIYAAVIAILVFGVWGAAYDAASFIYFQF